MRIGIANFKGQIPRTHPRLLPDGFAQVALNARMTDGSLTPYRKSALANTFPGTVATIYRHNDEWLGWVTDVDVVPGPVAADRLYFTGDGVPKVKAGATTYPLALPAPVSAPSVSPTGTPDPALVEAIFYTYTWVTSLDEESAPAPLSAYVDWSPGMTVTVGGFATTPSGRGIDRRRIYRSQTSASGVTDLYFVAEIVLATTSYVHDIATAPLAEVIPSLDYDPPPDAMTGLTELPNGIMAAFTGKELLFSEPFVPHAWPIKYRLKTNHPIVGLAAFGSTVAVMTEGTPYIVQGTAPENMTMERMESNLPCVSKQSIVDLGYAAAYASNDGLVMVTQSSSDVVSRGLFTKPEWQALSPDTIFAAQIEGKYAMAHISGAIETFEGGTPSVAAPDVFDLGAPVVTGDVVIYSGGGPLTTGDVRSLGIIDLTGEQPFFVDVIGDPSESPTGLYYENTTNTLFTIDAGIDARAFDAPGLPLMTQRWRSRLFVLTSLENFGAIWVETDDIPSETNVLTTRVYVDGTLAFETTEFNTPLRLPSGLLSNRWEIEVEGTATVQAITMAGSIAEVMG